MTLIVCGGMPRAASTLQYDIAARLITVYGGGTALGWWASASKESRQFAAYKTDQLCVIKRHAYVTLPCRALYIYRDIRDVCVSAMNDGKHKKSFESIYYRGIPDAVRWFEEWTHHPDVLVSRYSDVIANIPAEVDRIARFLHIWIPYDEPQRCKDMFDAEGQKKYIEAHDYSSHPEHYDPVRLLHEGHLQSGKVGRFETELTDDQKALFIMYYGDWLRLHGYC